MVTWAARRCVFDRVIEQVEEDLMKSLRVGANSRKIIGNLQRNSDESFKGLSRQFVDDGLGGRVHGDGLEIEAGLLGFERGYA